MSKKGVNKEKSYLEWNDATDLVYRLTHDGNYAMAAFILIGIYTGFKVGEIRKLRWANLLYKFELLSNGIRLKLNDDFSIMLNYIYKCAGEPPKTQYILLSNKKVPYCVQRLNILLKEINDVYGLGIKDFTTHTLRRTFGRKIVEDSKNKSAALSSVCCYFNHASPSITLDYLSFDDLKIKRNSEIGINDAGIFDSFKDKKTENVLKTKCGFVYIMKDGNYPGIVKIGKSITPVYRESTLSHTIPLIQLYKVVKTKNMSELERVLHKTYEEKRVRGEWFKLSEKELQKLVEQYGFVDVDYYFKQNKCIISETTIV